MFLYAYDYCQYHVFTICSFSLLRPAIPILRRIYNKARIKIKKEILLSTFIILDMQLNQYFFNEISSLIFYFGTNILLTLHNKWILENIKFKFPWILTALHILISAFGSILMTRMAMKSLKLKDIPMLLLYSFIYGANISLSNYSLACVSLSFHQMIRSTTPIMILLVEIAFLKKSNPITIYLSILPVFICESLLFRLLLACVSPQWMSCSI
jgi:hypothetical protein